MQSYNPTQSVFRTLRDFVARGMGAVAHSTMTTAPPGTKLQDCVPHVPHEPAVRRSVGPEGIALIKRFEGCARLRTDGLVEAYPDPGSGGEPWTIGWGSTGPDRFHGGRIGPGTIWTREQCDRRLEADLLRYARDVSAALGDAPTSQHQFDALVSFHYNTGAIARATLTRRHIAGEYAAARAEFARWNKAGGRILRGLTRRRTEEARLYSGVCQDCKMSERTPYCHRCSRKRRHDMRMLIASAAAIALASGGAMAQPGNGNGKGGGKSHAAAQKSGGGHKADPGNRGRDRVKAAVAPRSNGRNDAARNNPGSASKRDAGKSSFDREDRRERVAPAIAPYNNGKPDKQGHARDRKAHDDDFRFVDRDRNFGVLRDYDRRSVAYNGCPPGLAKKYNGCMPPGLAKKRGDYRPSFFGYDGLGSGRYFYDDGFLLRLGDNGRIAASIPLLGGALAIGNPWPEYYRPVELRPYYRNYYGLQSDAYRYANNTIYRVDPETAAITSIAALLTGDDFTVGQPMPAGYDVYNVPYRYRSQYYDRPDAHYRYSDGYVYQVDPKTRLVAAAIELALD